MDWTTILMTMATTLISGGGIAGLVFFKDNKRARQLQNEASASAQWRELYDKMEQKHDALSLKVDGLYKENKLLRDENNNLTTQCAVLELWKCNRISCVEREPPIGSK